jgi:RNA polymerase sigma factor (sigma-70 family)
MNENIRLWDQFVEGDDSCLGALYESLFEPLFFVSFFIVKNKDHACDIVGDLFTNLLCTSLAERKQKWKSIDEIDKYLNAMIRNKSIDHIRSIKNRERILKGIQFSKTQQTDVNAHEVLNHLSILDKELMGLHIAGYNNHEIADQYKLSEKTIRNRLSKSRKLLFKFRSVMLIFI